MGPGRGRRHIVVRGVGVLHSDSPPSITDQSGSAQYGRVSIKTLSLARETCCAAVEVKANRISIWSVCAIKQQLIELNIDLSSQCGNANRKLHLRTVFPASVICIGNSINTLGFISTFKTHAQDNLRQIDVSRDSQGEGKNSERFFHSNPLRYPFDCWSWLPQELKCTSQKMDDVGSRPEATMTGPEPAELQITHKA